MAVAVQIDVPGVTVKQYDLATEFAGFVQGGPLPSGGLFHWVAKTDSGIRIVNVWASRGTVRQVRRGASSHHRGDRGRSGFPRSRVLRCAQLPQWYWFGGATRVMSDASWASDPSLAEEQSQLTRSRIRQAAMRVVAHHGFEATVGEIAELSGVSPRTIFRHYKSQRALIASTLQDMFEAGNRPIDGLPRPSDDLDGWLKGLTLALHTRGVHIFGEVIWDLLPSPGTALPVAISEIIDAQVDFRRNAVQHFTTIAWQAAGGKGQAPDSLTSAFIVQLSPFTTKTLMVERDQTPAQVAALSADVLKTLLQRAVDEQNRAQPDIAGAAGADETEN